jgi:hypothetical protein
MFRTQICLANVVILAAIATPAVAQEELEPTREQILELLPPGFGQSGEQPDSQRRWVYTHRNGQFVVDPRDDFQKSPAVFLSRPIGPHGKPNGPLQGYHQMLYNLGDYEFPYDGKLGYLCFAWWNDQPWQEMPIFLWFAKHSCHSHHCHCHGYHVYSWRYSTKKWRYVGSFDRHPEGRP